MHSCRVDDPEQQSPRWTRCPAMSSLESVPHSGLPPVNTSLIFHDTRPTGVYKPTCTYMYIQCTSARMPIRAEAKLKMGSIHWSTTAASANQCVCLKKLRSLHQMWKDQPRGNYNDGVQQVPGDFTGIREEPPLVQLDTDEQLEKEDHQQHFFKCVP